MMETSEVTKFERIVRKLFLDDPKGLKKALWSIALLAGLFAIILPLVEYLKEFVREEWLCSVGAIMMWLGAMSWAYCNIARLVKSPACHYAVAAYVVVAWTANLAYWWGGTSVPLVVIGAVAFVITAAFGGIFGYAVTRRRRMLLFFLPLLPAVYTLKKGYAEKKWPQAYVILSVVNLWSVATMLTWPLSYLLC